MDFENANSLKALVNKGTLYPFKTLKPLDFGALEILSPAHLVSLTSALRCVVLWYSEVWGVEGGNPLSLETLEFVDLWSR